mgnify:CR=1 FL=1
MADMSRGLWLQATTLAVRSQLCAWRGQQLGLDANEGKEVTAGTRCENRSHTNVPFIEIGASCKTS